MQTVTVTLLRHAKSSWADADQSDHDRPLNRRGNADAPEMARRLVARDTIPTVILCSSATRTRQTTAHLLSIFGEPAPRVQYLNSLYLASANTLLDELETVADSEHIMIVAHNPGIEQLSAQLQGEEDDTMPTAAVRQFSCPSITSLREQLRTPASDIVAESGNCIDMIYSDYPKNTSG